MKNKGKLRVTKLYISSDLTTQERKHQKILIEHAKNFQIRENGLLSHIKDQNREYMVRME